MSWKSDLLAPIEYLQGIGPAKADVLRKELAIYTQGQLLYHYPFRYIDRTEIAQVSDIRMEGGEIQLKGTISKIRIGTGRGRRMTAIFKDDTGMVELVWFQGIAWVEKTLKEGETYLVYGKPGFYRGNPQITHPECQWAGGGAEEKKRRTLVPVYHSTEKLKRKGLDSKGILRAMEKLIGKLSTNDIRDFIPQAVLKDHRLLGRLDAYKEIHLPSSPESLSAAVRRIKFEEFFLIQARILRMKMGRQKIAGFTFPELGDYFNGFFEEKLPFELTRAQKRVLKDIRRDTMRNCQMNRLLQGDVGSGKTIVALMTMLMALDNGFQACLMAPTEILAQQHYSGLTELLDDIPIRIELLTGSVKTKARREIHEGLENGEVHILLGTHALLEPKVMFKNLGMVVIDEQHRFGVAQRAKLWKKNTRPPHVLVMTATPIPRTLAMTVHGDLDVSVIDELPPGRKPVKTVHRYDKDRLRVFGFLKEQLELGLQAYIVYPLIDESETLDLKDLTDGYESVERAFPQYTVCCVHGKMKPVDKDIEMQRFVKGEAQIMVATTVIEVGVNVPNASIMVIESAERFGLAQLHQLRGRVGRGADQSFCILMTSFKLSKNGRTRIKTMCDTTDGFRISEVDLELRGPGNIEGTEQSGLTGLRLADIVQDQVLLHQARSAADEILAEDPELELPQSNLLRIQLDKIQKAGNAGIEWSRIS